MGSSGSCSYSATQPPPASGNAEKPVNRKPIYKSYVKWEDSNQTQGNKTIFFWVSNLPDGVCLVEADLANDNAEEADRASIANKHDKAQFLHLQTDPTAAALWSAVLGGKSRTQVDDHDGQGGTVCPFDSLAGLFNDPTNIYANTCIIPNRTDESCCYIPEADMKMVAR
jgi:hypothetical protein